MKTIFKIQLKLQDEKCETFPKFLKFIDICIAHFTICNNKETLKKYADIHSSDVADWKKNRKVPIYSYYSKY